MKNRKLVKVFSLIAVLAALITCMFVMNVSAETADPEILSTNLVYGDQIQIMFATNVPTTEALGDLKVAYYKKNPATNQDAEVFYATALPADSIYNYKVDDVTYWTFLTDGIPASSVSAERFATVFYGSEIPADATYKTYSVMEYLFTRLYKQDFISKEDGTIDGNKKNLYLKMIDYTAFAQQVLVNDNANIAEDIRLITDYNYVYAKGASINGAGSTLILAGGGEVTLTLNDGTGSTNLTGWVIYTYDAAGNLLKSEPATVNTISVTSHTVIAPPSVDEDPTYIEFDNWATGPVGAHSSNRITSFTEGTNTNPGSNFSIINDNGNNKLLYNGSYNGTSDTFHVSAHNSSENANVTVLEMDIEWLQGIDTRSNLFNIDLYAGSNLVYNVQINARDFAAAATKSARIRLKGVHANGTSGCEDDSNAYAKAGCEISSVYLAPKELWRSSTGSYYDYNSGSTFDDIALGSFQPAAAASKCNYQFKLRIEYYHSVDDGNGGKTGMVKWYLDDVCVGLYDYTKKTYADNIVPELTTDITSVYLRCASENRPVVYTIDNLRIENTEKTYEAYVPKN